MRPLRGNHLRPAFPLPELRGEPVRAGGWRRVPAARETGLTSPGVFTRIGDLFHRFTGKPYPAEQVFGDALDQAELYNDLLRKVGGDHDAAERLIDFERRQSPNATRKEWLQSALQRWERDNRSRNLTDLEGF